MPLDLGVKTAAGLTWANGCGDVHDETRICICSVEGDARARWLVVHELMTNDDDGALTSQVLLRCEGCCAECTIKTVSAMQGNWLMIL